MTARLAGVKPGDLIYLCLSTAMTTTDVRSVGRKWVMNEKGDRWAISNGKPEYGRWLAFKSRADADVYRRFANSCHQLGDEIRSMSVRHELTSDHVKRLQHLLELQGQLK